MKLHEKLLAMRGDIPRSVVSRKTGIPYNTLQYIEAGETDPGISKVIKLVHYYGKTLNDVCPDGEDLEDILYKE